MACLVSSFCYVLRYEIVHPVINSNLPFFQLIRNVQCLLSDLDYSSVREVDCTLT